MSVLPLHHWLIKDLTYLSFGMKPGLSSSHLLVSTQLSCGSTASP
jgi:hypothetical protein